MENEKRRFIERNTYKCGIEERIERIEHFEIIFTTLLGKTSKLIRVTTIL